MHENGEERGERERERERERDWVRVNWTKCLISSSSRGFLRTGRVGLKLTIFFFEKIEYLQNSQMTRNNQKSNEEEY
jgi:hypothetical protein